MKKLIVLAASGILVFAASCNKGNDATTSNFSAPSKTINLNSKAKFNWSSIWNWVKGIFSSGPGVHVTYKVGSYYERDWTTADGASYHEEQCYPTNAVCIADVVVTAMTANDGTGHSFEGVFGYTNDGHHLALAVCEDLSNPEYVKNYVDQKVFNAKTPIRLPAEAKAELGLPDDYVIPAGEYPINYIQGGGFYVVFQ